MGQSEIVYEMYIWFALVFTERVLFMMLERSCMIKGTDCSISISFSIENEFEVTNATSGQRFQSVLTIVKECQLASSSFSKFSGRTSDDNFYESVSCSLSKTYFFHYLELSSFSQRVVEGLYNSHIRHKI